MALAPCLFAKLNIKMKSFANIRLAFSSHYLKKRKENSKGLKIIMSFSCVQSDSPRCRRLITWHTCRSGVGVGPQNFLLTIFDYLSFISEFTSHIPERQRTAGKVWRLLPCFWSLSVGTKAFLVSRVGSGRRPSQPRLTRSYSFWKRIYLTPVGFKDGL